MSNIRIIGMAGDLIYDRLDFFEGILDPTMLLVAILDLRSYE